MKALLISWIFVTGCLAQNQQIKEPKKSKSYSFLVSNQISSAFGYRIGEDGVPISASDILIVDTLCYILDAAKDNFKIVNLRTGKLTTSQPISIGSEELFLTDLVSFNNHIYILSARGNVYKYNRSGKFLKTIVIDNYFNEKFLYSVETDHFTVFQDTDIEATSDGKQLLTIKRIDSNDQIISENIKLSEPVENLVVKNHGKGYSLDIVNGKHILKTNVGNFGLTKSITEAKYPCTNFDFQKDIVIFFEANINSLVLYCTWY
jgi:hypothetical protein